MTAPNITLGARRLQGVAPVITSPVPINQGVPRNFRKLEPLSDTVDSKPAFGNRAGDVFVLETKEYPSGVFSDSQPMHIVLRQVSGEPSQRQNIIARLHIGKDAIKWDSVKAECDKSQYEKPPEARRGYGFFGIFLEEVKRIARAAGIGVIKGTPADDDLVDYYHKFGFTGSIEVRLVLN